jgi:hypothetical protein
VDKKPLESMGHEALAHVWLIQEHDSHVNFKRGFTKKILRIKNKLIIIHSNN